jgi:hypothetical protein
MIGIIWDLGIVGQFICIGHNVPLPSTSYMLFVILPLNAKLLTILLNKPQIK